MACALTDTAAQISNELAERIGPQRFKIWFKHTTRFAVADGLLNIGVPNQFVGTWIENHYGETIGDIAKSVAGKRLQVAFAVDPKLNGQARKRLLDQQAEFVERNAQRTAPPSSRRGFVAPPRQLRGRLDEFVVGPCNRMAHSAATAIAEGNGAAVNPLFLYAGCGMGKTHLLQGVCNAVTQRDPSRQCLYVTGEEFTNQFLVALKRREQDAFRAKYRNVDVLVIDDIHFLANKKATQEEFLHTYNTIEAAGKQVVMASDTHPKLMGRLPETLVSRFVCGMVVRIDPLDHATRCEILRQRAARLKRDVPDDVIAYIADNLQSNVRELEGALVKLLAFASLLHEPITVAMAQRALADYLPKADRMLTVNDIESVVAAFFGISPADLHSSRKTQIIALARSIAMSLARKHTQMSFPEIARTMGNKNHSTVIHACRRIETKTRDGESAKWQSLAGRMEMPITELISQIEAEIRRSR